MMARGIANRSVLDTGQITKSIFQLRQKNDALFIIRVFLTAETHLRNHEPIDTPARIGIDEALQAAQKQSRGCK